MKLSKEQRIRLYETVMNKIAPVVYNRLYEMSDDLLDRAIVASIDKGDVQRAKKFSDYNEMKHYVEEMYNLTKYINDNCISRSINMELSYILPGMA